MTVKEMFSNEKIDFDWIVTRMTDVSDYYTKCYNFLNDNWNRDIETLSVAQYNWMDKILEDCIEKRIEEQ